MSDEVLVDALPYIDTGYEEPGVREAALAMVEEETKEYRPTKNYLEHLPSLNLHAFETDILKGEFERMASRHAMDQLPMKRYELPHPPAGKMTDPAAWNECVDNSMAQLQHQFTRITNLDLMMEFSCEAWKSYCTTLTNMLAVAQRRLQSEKKNVQELNWQRKSTQTAAGDQIKKLETEWVGLVSKNFEIERECLKLQKKIEILKKEGKPPRPLKRRRNLENEVPPVAEIKKKFRKIEEREKSPEYEPKVPKPRTPPRRRYAEDSDEEDFVDKDDLRKYDLAGAVSDDETEDERRANSEERDEERYDRHGEIRGERDEREEERRDRREEDRREERQDSGEEEWKDRDEEQERRREERDDRRGEERKDRREDSEDGREEEYKDMEDRRKEREDARDGRDDRREEAWQERRDRREERWEERREDDDEREDERREKRRRRRYSSSSSSSSSSSTSSSGTESEGEKGGEAMDLENTDSE